MGMTIWGDDAKNVNDTHLLVIMRTRLSKKTGLINLKNQTRF